MKRWIIPEFTERSFQGGVYFCVPTTRNSLPSFASPRPGVRRLSAAATPFGKVFPENASNVFEGTRRSSFLVFERTRRSSFSDGQEGADSQSALQVQNPTGRERRAYAHCVAAILLDGRQFFPGVRRAKLPCSARDVTDSMEASCSCPQPVVMFGQRTCSRSRPSCGTGCTRTAAGCTRAASGATATLCITARC